MSRSKSSKSLVIYSDIHTGSRHAVCTNDPINGYKPNQLQKEFFQIWNETIDSLHQKPRFKVINGEPFDGVNKKSNGAGQWSVSMGDQILEAEKLIKLIPGDETILVKGSGYHVDDAGTSYEEILAMKIGAKKYSTWYNDSFAEDFCQIRLNGVLFNITHHIGFARWAAYRTTALAREMAALHFMKDNLGDVGVMVRSHVHYFVAIKFVHSLGFTNPAWKYPDRHLFRGGMGGVIPNIGCTEVIVESNGKIILEPHIVDVKQKAGVIEA